MGVDLYLNPPPFDQPTSKAGIDQEKAKKYWIQTFTGRKFFPLDPDSSELDLVDQAVALSRICRYGGHTDRHYSVAEHAWRMSVEAERRGYSDEVRRWCLIHDNPEAYLGDMVRPMKVQDSMTPFREREQHLLKKIARWVGLPEEEPKQVRELDTEILTFEAHRIKVPVREDWELKPLPPGAFFIPGSQGSPGWPAEEARRCYMWRFRVLWGDEALRICPSLFKWV